MAALATLVGPGLRLCQAAGRVKLGPGAVEGTKVKANAAKPKAMSYGRLEATEQKLEPEGKSRLAQAAAGDGAEDARSGPDKRGDELPTELARRESRLRKIREAQAALEQEARAQAEAAAAASAQIAERPRYEAETGQKAKGRAPPVPDPTQARPEAKAQRNFTDPDSRSRKDGARKAVEQADHAQAAVASQAQIIVAAAVTPDANDTQQLVPRRLAGQANVGQLPEKASADTGFLREATLTAKALAGVDWSVPPERQHHPAPGAGAPAASAEGSVREQLRPKLQTPDGQAVYKLRKAIVEPVFGQSKEGRGVRRFSFRGLAPVAAEWVLICLTPNLLQLFRGRTGLLAA